MTLTRRVTQLLVRYTYTHRDASATRPTRPLRLAVCARERALFRERDEDPPLSPTTRAVRPRVPLCGLHDVESYS